MLVINSCMKLRINSILYARCHHCLRPGKLDTAAKQIELCGYSGNRLAAQNKKKAKRIDCIANFVLNRAEFLC